jgi:hypothetical protein
MLRDEAKHKMNKGIEKTTVENCNVFSQVSVEGTRKRYTLRNTRSFFLVQFGKL